MRAALLVDPTGFAPSAESAEDNRYVDLGPVDVERAHAQHAAVARALAALGVPVVTFAGRDGLDEGVFPNNVFATAPGRFLVGRMRHEVRRREAARQDVRRFFTGLLRYETIDLSGGDAVAELTGPLVIDRSRGIGYCGMSPRVDPAGAEAMHEAFDLRLTYRFPLVPSEYHTNLVLASLAGRACLLHGPSFADEDGPRAIARLHGDRALLLTDEEKAAFAGNCLAITERDVLFSATALAALRPESRARLEDWGFALHGVAIDELEKGGGSLRCLIAEIF